jgi:SET domain-containing protein
MFIDIQQTYNKIENDLLSNTDELFNRYDYYTHKYRGDRLNDVNVGLFLNDQQQPTAQIFVRNKTGYIKTHLIFNRAGTNVKEIITLNYKIND